MDRELRSRSRKKKESKGSSTRNQEKNSQRTLEAVGVTVSDSTTQSDRQEDFSETVMATAESKDSIERKLDQLLAKMDRVELNLSEKINSVIVRLNQTEKRIDSLESKVEELQGKVISCELKIQELEGKVEIKNHLIKSLEDNVDDIQGRIRRKTLIFNGFPEGVEGSGGWPACKDFISSFISECFNMAGKVIIERAHCTPAFRNPNRKYPRPIHIAFLLWEQANEIAMSAQRVLKEKPYAHKGEELKLFVNQMCSPRVTQLRKQALKTRWELKQEHKDWIIYLWYPAKIFMKKHEDDVPVEYKWETNV